MAHHLFTDIADVAIKSNSGFYKDGYLPPVAVPCSREEREQLVRDGRNQEVVSRFTYLMDYGVQIAPDDKVDGLLVIQVRSRKGFAFAYKEVLT